MQLQQRSKLLKAQDSIPVYGIWNMSNNVLLQCQVILLQIALYFYRYISLITRAVTMSPTEKCKNIIKEYLFRSMGNAIYSAIKNESSDLVRLILYISLSSQLCHSH